MVALTHITKVNPLVSPLLLNANRFYAKAHGIPSTILRETSAPMCITQIA
jgi:hypothetical protein